VVSIAATTKTAYVLPLLLVILNKAQGTSAVDSNTGFTKFWPVSENPSGLKMCQFKPLPNPSGSCRFWNLPTLYPPTTL
jgi:hypothetical protein